MPNIYLDQFEYTTVRGLPAWRASGDAIGLLDLRNTAQLSAAGGAPQGYGIFVYAAPQTGLALSLGDDIRGSPTALQRSGLETLLGLAPGAIAARRLDLVLAELFNAHADVRGETRWRPLMPQVDGRLVLNLGGFSPIWSERYKHSDHPLVLEALREGYLKIKAESEQGLHRDTEHNVDLNHHLRVVSAWMRKYGIEPSDVGAPGSLPHRTPITDDFNRTDGELGANWTDDAGDADVLSNQYDVTSAVAISRYSGTSLSSDDNYCQAKVVTRGASYQGPITRKTPSSTQTFYSALLQQPGNETLQIYKFVGGTPTLLINAAITHSANDTYKIECDGSTQRQYQNGTQRGGDGTDTAIVDNLQTGLIAAAADTIMDDFEAADLAAPPAVARRRVGFGAGYAIRR